MPNYFPEGNTPLPSDDIHRSLQKIVSLLGGSPSPEDSDMKLYQMWNELLLNP